MGTNCLSRKGFLPMAQKALALRVSIDTNPTRKRGNVRTYLPSTTFIRQSILPIFTANWSNSIRPANFPPPRHPMTSEQAAPCSLSHLPVLPWCVARLRAQPYNGVLSMSKKPFKNLLARLNVETLESRVTPTCTAISGYVYYDVNNS